MTEIAFWCTALARPWTWAWIAYPGIWLSAIIPAVVYVRVIRTGERATSKRQIALFMVGMAVYWLATDWPLGTLGAGYLASAHMLQYLLYTLVAAPLILLGTPRWMAESVLRRLRLSRIASSMGRSLVLAGLTYNLLMISTHAPVTVDTLRVSQVGSLVMDVLWLLAGFILWWPVIAPIVEMRHPRTPSKIAYLFLTTTVVAILPASFLTFANFPLYATYELAPRIGGMSSINDQQLAGLIMKLVTPIVVWPSMAVMWFRWSAREGEHTEGATLPRT
ncbi:MAG: hypothetical protein GEU79_03050 [Acidimicrobiia bacterium]|nr:hypothetical protein [Acidimicrobiia bacterium]